MVGVGEIKLGKRDGSVSRDLMGIPRLVWATDVHAFDGGAYLFEE